MHLVLWNDDGYQKRHLVDQVAASVAEREKPESVTKYFPSHDTTGLGGYLRIGHRINYREQEDGIIVSGYPAEIPFLIGTSKADTICVVVNDGVNLGTDIFNSGTVLSAVQAGWLGFRAVAVGFPRGLKKVDTDQIALIRYVMNYSPRPPMVMNVNLREKVDSTRWRFVDELSGIRYETTVREGDGSASIHDTGKSVRGGGDGYWYELGNSTVTRLDGIFRVREIAS